MYRSFPLFLLCWLVVRGGTGLFGHTGSVPPPVPVPVVSAVPEPSAVAVSDAGIRLGILVPDTDAGRAVRQGAELAVARANEAGGYRGRPFELVVRSDDGPWGSGSNALVRLVFEDEVLAILGGLDGRRAHLAEQVVTKGRVALVSPWASDPTLTQINIPWFFRCVPDDRRQALALVEALQASNIAGTAVVVDEANYDARTAADAFHRAAAGTQAIRRIAVGPGSSEDALEQIIAARAEALVLFAPPERSAQLVRAMQARGLTQEILGPLFLQDPVFLNAVSTFPDRVRLVAPGQENDTPTAVMLPGFEERFGYLPPPIAAYAYDGMGVLIEAVRRSSLDGSSLDRNQVREALASLTYPLGVTGLIRFDDQGNRTGPVTLVEVR